MAATTATTASPTAVNQHKFGCFFAILPAHPTSISPAHLKQVCDKIAIEEEHWNDKHRHAFDDRNKLSWTFSWSPHYFRSSSLIHPQLTQPLPFLEYSGMLRLQLNDDDNETSTATAEAERICQEIIVTRLNKEASMIGNSELLLVLKDTPIPVLDTDLPSVDWNAIAAYQAGKEEETITTTTKTTLMSGHRAKKLFDRYGLLSLPQVMIQNKNNDNDNNENAIKQQQQSSSTFLSLEQLEQHVTTHFECLYGALCSRKKSQETHFLEIMARDRNRFDFRLDLPLPIQERQQQRVPPSTTSGPAASDETTNDDNDNSMIERIQEMGQHTAPWLPILQVIFSDEKNETEQQQQEDTAAAADAKFSFLRCGCVLSLPGTGMQYWHSDGFHTGKTASFEEEDEDNSDIKEDTDDDGKDVENNKQSSAAAAAAPCHACCVFVPLIDLTESTGYTEFWAGSHKYDQLLQHKGTVESLPGGTMGLLSKGDVLLYDYRTIHRGVSNTSRNTSRPIVYFLYTRKGYEWIEDQNFTKKSIFS